MRLGRSGVLHMAGHGSGVRVMLGEGRMSLLAARGGCGGV